MICRSCTNATCREENVSRQNLDIECPTCDGRGCKECRDGSFAITGCPNRYCSEIVTAVEMIDLFGKGLTPILGGMLDQSASFIEAARFFEGEERRIENERINSNSNLR